MTLRTTESLDAEARAAIRKRDRLRPLLALGVLLFAGRPVLFASTGGSSLAGWLKVLALGAFLGAVWTNSSSAQRFFRRRSTSGLAQLPQGVGIEPTKRAPLSYILIAVVGATMIWLETISFDSNARFPLGASIVLVTIFSIILAVSGFFLVLGIVQLLKPSRLVLTPTGVVVRFLPLRAWEVSFDSTNVEVIRTGGFHLGTALAIGFPRRDPERGPFYLPTARLKITAWEVLWILEHFREHPEDRSVLGTPEGASFVEELLAYEELEVDDAKTAWFRPPPAAWVGRTW